MLSVWSHFYLVQLKSVFGPQRDRLLQDDAPATLLYYPRVRSKGTVPQRAIRWACQECQGIGTSFGPMLMRREYGSRSSIRRHAIGANILGRRSRTRRRGCPLVLNPKVAWRAWAQASADFHMPFLGPQHVGLHPSQVMWGFMPLIRRTDWTGWVHDHKLPKKGIFYQATKGGAETTHDSCNSS